MTGTSFTVIESEIVTGGMLLSLASRVYAPAKARSQVPEKAVPLPVMTGWPLMVTEVMGCRGSLPFSALQSR